MKLPLETVEKLSLKTSQNLAGFWKVSLLLTRCLDPSCNLPLQLGRARLRDGPKERLRIRLLESQRCESTSVKDVKGVKTDWGRGRGKLSLP